MADLPDQVTTGTAPSFEDLSAAIAGAFAKVGKFSFLTADPLDVAARVIALLLAIPLKLLTSTAVFAAKVIIDTLATDRPELNQLTATVLSDIFDAPISFTSRGSGTAAAAAIGGAVMDNLLGAAGSGTSDGSPVGPDAGPAKEFLGKLLGVSVRGWAIDLVADLGSLGHIKAFNDLVEDLIGSLGIGRLTRVALQPAIHAAIAQPLQWLILDTLRPTLLSEGQAVKAFLSGDWTEKQLDDELGAKGYNSDRIAQVIKDQEARIPPSDVLVLVRNLVWDEGQATQYLMESGYPNGVATSIVQADHLREIDALRGRAIAAFELQYKRGKLDDGGFTQALAALNVRPDVSAYWLGILQAERAAGFKNLTKAELDAALSKNIISRPEWRTGLTVLGYSDDDITILELTDQQALADKESAAAAKTAQKTQAAQEKAAAAKAAADAKAAAAAAKATAAQTAAAAKAQAAADKTAALIQKQTLLAQQAQARRDQVAATQAAGKISAADAAQALADIQTTQNAAAATVATQTAQQKALDAQASALDSAQLTAQTAADAAAQALSDATAQAANQTAALQERRQERIDFYEAERAKVQTEMDQGLTTANAGQKALDQLQVQEDAAVKQEQLDQLAIARAVAAAKKTSTAAAAKAAKAAAAATLIPTATSRSLATTAAAAAQTAQVKAQTASATAAAKSKIAADQATSIQTATAALDALNAKLLADLQAWEAQHPGV